MVVVYKSELEKMCRFWGWNLNEYIESFKRQYPDIEIIGEESGRIQKGREQR